MVAAGTINQTIGLQHDQPDSLAVPIGSVIEELDKWIKRLLDKLAEIVTNLAKGTSFSITVGTSVTVTVNFPPIDQE
jgi:hypothetical protein